MNSSDIVDEVRIKQNSKILSERRDRASDFFCSENVTKFPLFLQREMKELFTEIHRCKKVRGSIGAQTKFLNSV